MKIKSIHYVLIVSLLSVSTLSAANSELKIGNKLTTEQQAELKGKKVEIANETFVIVEKKPTQQNRLQTRSTNSAVQTTVTQVVNQQGVVGISDNSVLISSIPVQEVQSRASHIINLALEKNYYTQTHISRLKFANFEQANRAFNDLKKLFPDAQVTLPIQYSTPKSR